MEELLAAVKKGDINTVARIAGNQKTTSHMITLALLEALQSKKKAISEYLLTKTSPSFAILYFVKNIGKYEDPDLIASNFLYLIEKRNIILSFSEIMYMLLSLNKSNDRIISLFLDYFIYEASLNDKQLEKLRNIAEKSLKGSLSADSIPIKKKL